MRRRVLLLGGDGGVSGVPRYIETTFGALNELSDVELLVVAEENQGGFDWAPQGKFISIKGLTFKNLMHSVGAVLKLRNLLIDKGVNVVWANSTLSILIARLACPSSAALVTTYHGVPFGQHSMLHSMVGRLLELGTFLRRSDIDFIISKNDQGLLRKAVRKPAKQDLYLPNTVRSEFETSVGHKKRELVRCRKSRRLRIGSVGRNCNQKQFPQLLEDFDAIENDIFELQLLGPGVSHLQTHTKSMNITLSEDSPSVFEFMENLDIYVCSSSYEGFSLAMLEASCVGLPIVTTNVGGVQDLKDAGYPVFIYTPGDRTFYSALCAAKEFVNSREKSFEIYEKSFGNASWKMSVKRAILEILQKA